MSYTSPRVSVIIPTYNRGHLIRDAVDSVLLQSFDPFELIIIDDGSTDATPQIFRSIKDSRVIYERLETNRGRSHVRNVALKMARGEYIAFLDSDDLFLPGKLDLQVRYLDNHADVSMVYTHAHCLDLIRDFKTEYLATKSGHIYKHIAFFVPLTIILPTVMVRRHVFETVGGFDVHLNRFEDTDMWRRISKNHLIHAIPKYTCLIRTHNDNTLKNQNPLAIIEDLQYYTQKIISENIVDKKTLMNGLYGLYYYYISALDSVPHFSKYATELEAVLENYGRQLFPNQWGSFILKKRLKRKIKKILKRCYSK